MSKRKNAVSLSTDKFDSSTQFAKKAKVPLTEDSKYNVILIIVDMKIGVFLFQ
jgi:hypothetical protein